MRHHGCFLEVVRGGKRAREGRAVRPTLNRLGELRDRGPATWRAPGRRDSGCQQPSHCRTLHGLLIHPEERPSMVT
jgi:hypothetical protein